MSQLQYQQQNLHATRYGVTVALFKGKDVYMSRRSERLLFGKKWQFINGRMKGNEFSRDAAIRIVEKETGLTLTKDRFCDVENITIDETSEFYYVYLVHLKDGEVVANPADGNSASHDPWRLFPLEASCVLDLVPGIRDILRKLKRTLCKIQNAPAQHVLTQAEMEEANKVYDEQRIREEQQAFHNMDSDFCCGC